jgi:hypothetical protein
VTTSKSVNAWWGRLPPWLQRTITGIFLTSLLLVSAPGIDAQNTPELREILGRLDRLEKDNRSLTDEVHALRKELADLHSPPTGEIASDGGALEDHAAVQQARIEELAQTKVESSQKFPIRFTGMALFNAYVNSRHNNQSVDPTIASFGPGDATGGATLRQSTLGLLFNGPLTIGGAKVSGSLYMDFFGGSAASLNHLLRLRTAEVDLDWTHTSIMFGQAKPLISPRDPDSLAQVGVSPLTGAGNLWLWQPQVRIEQRMALGTSSGIRAQASVFQTGVLSTTPDPTGYNSSVPNTDTRATEYSRPGVEGRMELWRRWGETGRIEIAGGIHVNRNRLGTVSLPSDVYSVDWLFKPVPKIEFSGMFFHGRNVAPLGALRQGFSILSNGRIIPVVSNGGWAQIKLPITSRLTFNLYGGQQDDRNSDLMYGNIGKNQAYFGNVMYRLAPNVIVSLEGGQVRTNYKQIGSRLNDHYDLAIAYLF